MLRRATGFVTFRGNGYTVHRIVRERSAALNSTQLIQFVGVIAALVLIIPGVIWGLRDRRTALRNIAIWVALIGAAVLLFWLQVRPR